MPFDDVNTPVRLVALDLLAPADQDNRLAIGIAIGRLVKRILEE